jgi:hypothetical protein
MIELTLELLIESWLIVLAVFAGRRAASKTSKSNTLARRVSMTGATFGRRNLRGLEDKWRWKLILDNRVGGFTM